MQLSLRPRRHLAVALAGGLLLVPMACGDDDDATPATVVEPDGDGPAAPDDAEDPGVTTARIVISDFAFSGPGTVPVGTTVIVENADRAQHTWTSVDDVFDSGALAIGDTFSFTFDEPGEYAYVCAFHPAMTGTIIVTG
jgi:plastocyanin